MKRFYFKFKPWILITAVLLAGTAGTLYFYKNVLQWQEKIVQAEFKGIAGDRMASLQTMVNTDLTAVWALQGFFTATLEVTREEFAVFTGQLLRLQPHVDSYHWIPRVPDSERAVFEQAVQEELGTPFHIAEAGSNRHLVPARKAEEYYPSLFVEPVKKNHLALGFNQFSVSERRRSMMKAAASKTIIATRVHPLWRFLSDEKKAYFFVFLPVYEKGKRSETLEHRKAHLKGYVAAGFHAETLIQAAYTTSPMSELDLDFYAETVDAKNALIHQYQIYTNGRLEAPQRRASTRGILEIADQRWLVMAHATELFRNGAVRMEARGFLLAGFLLTLLLCAFLILWEQRKRQDFFLQISLKDELTGLYNRRGFLALGHEHLKLIRRKKMESLIFFADLDDLKEINDSYGHEEGDKALTAAAGILKNTFRDSDIVARTGGDEFAILAFDVGILDEVAILRHLQATMDYYNGRSSHPYKVQLSAGCVAIDLDREISLEEILAEADKVMYSNKRDHKTGESEGPRNMGWVKNQRATRSIPE